MSNVIEIAGSLTDMSHAGQKRHFDHLKSLITERVEQFADMRDAEFAFVKHLVATLCRVTEGDIETIVSCRDALIEIALWTPNADTRKNCRDALYLGLGGTGAFTPDENSELARLYTECMPTP